LYTKRDNKCTTHDYHNTQLMTSHSLLAGYAVHIFHSSICYR